VRPLLCLVRKELLQLRRDPALLRLVIMVPLVQLLVLAYAINNDLRNLRVSVLDEDHTPVSRRLTEALDHAEVFVPGPEPADSRQLARLLQEGRSDLAVHVPQDFSRDILKGWSPALGLEVDGTNSSIAGRGAGYALEVISRQAAQIAGPLLPVGAVQDGAGKGEATGNAGPTAAGGIGRTVAVPRFFYNPELESRFYMIPGIIVMLVTIISALVTGMAVVREKEIGTLEQVMVTPLSSLQFVAGKTLPFALIALLDLALATVFARLWFGVPLAGSPLVLLLGALLYLLVTLGLGLLASAVSNTQQQAMFTVWFFLIFTILLSGFFFPVENMPGWARALTYLNPMRFFLEIVRGIFLRGSGLADLAGQLLILLVMGVVSFAGAVILFRRTSR
jgi:ABC-2 type transport system permease protein